MLRNLFALRPVQREFITREQLREHLAQDLDENLDDVQETRELFVTLGVLDRAADYHAMLLSLYGETVLGFFDADDEMLFVVNDDDFDPNDVLTYAHEYVHSLQQQHFDIKAIRERLEDNSDQSLAFLGVIEGDATIGQTLYFFNYMDEQDLERLREIFAATDTAQFDASPHLVRRIFTFPYIEGYRFVLTGYLSEGETWGVIDDIYENPPRSTEQVLHPEKYVSGEEPIAVELPDLDAALGDDWTAISTDTLGEFLIMAYIEPWLESEAIAIAAASGWGGDKYTLLKGPNDANLLAVSIAWDTPEDAQEFFDLFSQAMTTRTALEWQPAGEGSTARTLLLADQAIYIALDAATTRLIYAPDPIVLESARAAIEAVEQPIPAVPAP